MKLKGHTIINNALYSEGWGGGRQNVKVHYVEGRGGRDIGQF